MKVPVDLAELIRGLAKPAVMRFGFKVSGRCSPTLLRTRRSGRSA